MFEEEVDVVWVIVEVVVGEVVGFKSVFFNDFGENVCGVLVEVFFVFLSVVEDFG